MLKEGNYFTGPAKFLVIIFGSGFAFLREICKISTAFQLPCNSHNSVSIERLPFVGANRFTPTGLTLETSASESLYGGQSALSTQLIKPNFLIKI